MYTFNNQSASPVSCNSMSMQGVWSFVSEKHISGHYNERNQRTLNDAMINGGDSLVLTGQYSLLEVYMYLISYVYVLNMSYHEAYNISCNILSMMRSLSGLGTFRHCVIP